MLARELARDLKLSAKRLSNYTPVFERIANTIIPETIGDVLLSAGSKAGTPWPKLTPKYVEAKRRNKMPIEPGIKTGRMRDEIAKANFVKKVSKDSLVTYPLSKHVFFFHYGVKKNNIPARPIWLLTDDAESMIADAVAEFIDGAIL